MKIEVQTTISNVVSIETLVKSVGLDRNTILAVIGIENDESKSLDEIVETLPYSKVVELASNLGYELIWMNND